MDQNFFEEDAKPKTLDNERLGEVGALADQLIKAQAKVSEAEAELAKAKSHERHLREESLPQAMQEIGMTKITLKDGRKIEVKEEVYASIPAANKPIAYNWLNEHGYGHLIKIEIKTAFGKGEAERARALMTSLSESGYEPASTESVHAQTLKAFIREQLEAGVNIPLDMFGARVVNNAKVK